MQLEQILIIPADRSVILRARTKTVTLSSDQISFSMGKAIDELVLGASSLLPPDTSEEDLEKIASLEGELRALKRKVGLIGADS